LLPIKTADYRRIVFDTLTGQIYPIPEMFSSSQMGWLDEQVLLLLDDTQNSIFDSSYAYNFVSGEYKPIWNGWFGLTTSLFNSDRTVLLTTCQEQRDGKPIFSFCTYKIQR
jgi:hypothetical protein